MHQVAPQQRKQEVLMRVAGSRVGVLESASRVRAGAGACLDVLHISGRALRYSAMVGAALTGVRLVRKMLPKPASAPIVVQKVPAAGAVADTSAPSEPTIAGGLLKYLIAQLVTLVILPWLRDKVTSGVVVKKVDYWRPSRIFFRMVGLEK